jgi:hypothetical protein
MWGLNNLELADNPDDTPVRKLFGDAISASYAQVNLRSYTRDALGTPRALGKHNRGHGENCSITRLSMIQCSDDISIRHPAAPGNLTQGQTFSAQLLNLRRENRSPWPTQTFAFCTSVSQTGTYAFYDEGALKFRDRTKYSEHHLPRGRRRVHRLGNSHKLNAQGTGGFEGSQQLRHAASKTIEAPNDYRIEPPSVGIGHHAI